MGAEEDALLARLEHASPPNEERSDVAATTRADGPSLRTIAVSEPELAFAIGLGAVARKLAVPLAAGDALRALAEAHAIDVKAHAAIWTRLNGLGVYMHEWALVNVEPDAITLRRVTRQEDL